MKIRVFENGGWSQPNVPIPSGLESVPFNFVMVPEDISDSISAGCFAIGYAQAMRECSIVKGSSVISAKLNTVEQLLAEIRDQRKEMSAALQAMRETL